MSAHNKTSVSVSEVILIRRGRALARHRLHRPRLSPPVPEHCRRAAILRNEHSARRVLLGRDALPRHGTPHARAHACQSARALLLV